MLKSQLVQKIERLEANLTNAKENSVAEASLRTLSTALLDKISEAQAEVEAETEVLGAKITALEGAYDSADKADDFVIALGEA